MIAYVLVGIVCFLAGIVALWAYDRIAVKRLEKYEAQQDGWDDDGWEWSASEATAEAWEASEAWDEP